MVSKRELARERARTQRALQRQAARRAADIRYVKLENILTNIRDIILHPDFHSLAADCGIRTVPQCLAQKQGSPIGQSVVDQYGDQIATFVVAWKFMSSILQDEKILDFIEARWPKFIGEFKDVFIATVTNGPFPGERKRTVPSLRQNR